MVINKSWVQSYAEKMRISRNMGSFCVQESSRVMVLGSFNVEIKIFLDMRKAGTGAPSIRL